MRANRVREKASNRIYGAKNKNNNKKPQMSFFSSFSLFFFTSFSRIKGSIERKQAIKSIHVILYQLIPLVVYPGFSLGACTTTETPNLDGIESGRPCTQRLRQFSREHLPPVFVPNTAPQRVQKANKIVG